MTVYKNMILYSSLFPLKKVIQQSFDVLLQIVLNKMINPNRLIICMNTVFAKINTPAA